MKLKKKLTDNLFLKLLSVGIAMIVWFVIANVSDWNEIANYAKNNPNATFAGKTIRLLY